MNNFQNGSFSGLLHKLTKYQSLAATASNSAKHSLYSRKVQEYKSKLDQMNNSQTQRGGLFQVSPENKDQVGKITQAIQKLVPDKFKTEYKLLAQHHSKLMEDLKRIKQEVEQRITNITGQNEAAAQAAAAQAAALVRALAEAKRNGDQELINLAQEAKDAHDKLMEQERKDNAEKLLLANLRNKRDAEQKRIDAIIAEIKKSQLQGKSAEEIARLKQAQADAEAAFAKAQAEAKAAAQAAEAKAAEDANRIAALQANFENMRASLATRDKRYRDFEQIHKSRNAELGGKLQAALSELEGAKRQLEELKRTTVSSQDCNTEIGNILSNINEAITTANSPQNAFDNNISVENLTIEAVEALNQLQLPAAATAATAATAAAAESVA